MTNHSQSPSTTTQEEHPAPGGSQFHAFRETVESVVIAFVLAFLFRTFEAEAFVIPTGSMSPSLQGQHKDVECPQCGMRFRASASEEGEQTVERLARLRDPNLPLQQRRQIEMQVQAFQVVGGQCPICRFTRPMRPDVDLPEEVAEAIDVEQTDWEPSYPGDRILVNKYGFSFHEPERWDVVVFKFPGDGNMNYIKRLVGLPNEQLEIFQGDLFAKPAGAAGEVEIVRKPPRKVEAMLQVVHDTEYDPTDLYRAGWPLRWQADSVWDTQIEEAGQTLDQQYVADNRAEGGDQFAWLNYRHVLPTQDIWEQVERLGENGPARLDEQALEKAKPALITDFNPYNARISRGQIMGGGPWKVMPHNQGMHWVGDLALEAEVEVEAAEGTLALELVEAGIRFQLQIDLATGKATARAIDARTGEATDLDYRGETDIREPGVYELKYANVDDQLLLWVDGEQIDLGDAKYEIEQWFESREEMLPYTSSDDPGDLAPARVGVRKAQATVRQLAVYRDIYYIAVDEDDPRTRGRSSGMAPGDYYSDYVGVHRTRRLDDGTVLKRIDNPRDLFTDPELWDRFRTRQARTFQTADQQYFVLGDNSPESQDCRLWDQVNGKNQAKPGGAYLDRRLLIGEAVCVFWPHSWGNWGGLPILNKLPGFPAFGDMRLVR